MHEKCKQVSNEIGVRSVHSRTMVCGARVAWRQVSFIEWETSLGHVLRDKHNTGKRATQSTLETTNQTTRLDNLHHPSLRIA